MKPVRKTASKTKATKPKRKTKEEPQVVLLFSDIKVSKWNRSFESEQDEKYIKELAQDINKHGLIHPLTLVPDEQGSSTHMVLAGANRLWALLTVRGKDSGLVAGEYNVRADITEADPKCLDISLSENSHRRQPSVIETARYVDRLLDQEKVDQTKLARKLHLRREVVNRSPKLVQCFSQLPAGWQKDLSQVPGRSNAARPAITATHWVEVAGAIDEGEITAEIQALMEDAAKSRWSTGSLRKALKKLKPPSPDEVAPSDPPDPSPETEPVPTPAGAGAAEANDGSDDKEQDATELARTALGAALDAIQTATQAVEAVLPAPAVKGLERAAKTVGGLIKQVEATVGNEVVQKAA